MVHAICIETLEKLITPIIEKDGYTDVKFNDYTAELNIKYGCKTGDIPIISTVSLPTIYCSICGNKNRDEHNVDGLNTAIEICKNR